MYVGGAGAVLMWCGVGVVGAAKYWRDVAAVVDVRGVGVCQRCKC